MSDNQDAGAHHGHPILTRSDVELLLCMSKWIETVNKFRDPKLPPFIPTHPDILKSRLFWRIRSGKEPLKCPPPTAYSCPWYELIDEPDRPHWAYELWKYKDHALTNKAEYQDRVSIAQCPYKVIKWGNNDEPEEVRFGPYHFKVWSGPSPYTSGRGEVGWWIQLINTDPTYVWSYEDMRA